jgi:hypothetical protein
MGDHDSLCAVMRTAKQHCNDPRSVGADIDISCGSFSRRKWKISSKKENHCRI